VTVRVLAVPRPARWYTEPLTVELPGATVAYRREGGGEPVLFLHGHWLTRRWTPFHARLAESVDLVAPEHPGFGESPAPVEPLDRDDLVLVYRDLLDALELPAVHVVGYGLGAWLAADLAVWLRPRVRSLSVIAPFGLRVPGSPIADVFILDPTTYDEVYFGGDAADFAAEVPGVGTPAQGGVEEFAQRYGELGAAARLMWQRRYDLKLDTRLPRLGLPALVVAAAEDRVVPAAHPARWAELLDARTVTVPGAGHALVLQCPQETADAVSAFVQEVSR